MRWARTLLIAAASGLAVANRVAWAEPARSPAKAEAQVHFKRAGEHYDRQEWRAALEEYREVLALTKNRAAMRGAALCLQNLEQYEEALEMYEELRKSFPVLPPAAEAQVATAMKELAGKVGTLALRGDLPAGASVIVDDRLRGTLPLDK